MTRVFIRLFLMLVLVVASGLYLFQIVTGIQVFKKYGKTILKAFALFLLMVIAFATAISLLGLV